MRYLIVNADDFGMSEGVNRGIIQAHECGIVTSASLMVREPGAKAAAAYARSHPELSVGLHLDFGEWTFRQGAWERLYEVVPVDDKEAVAAEVARQVELFRELIGDDPTHLDSHQHAHLQQPALGLVAAFAEEWQIPLRRVTSAVQHCGSFYGQGEEGIPYPDGITVHNLRLLMANLAPGWTELGCHPGYPEGLRTSYREERVQEIAALCDPAIRSALEEMKVGLRSFRDLRHVTS